MLNPNPTRPLHRRPTRQPALAALLLVLLTLAGCAAPGPTASPLRLPTRVPPTPSATPIGAQAYYEMGLARRAAGDTTGALRALSQALEIDPTLAQAHVERAAIQLARGNAQASLADAQAALAVDPEHALAHVVLGEVMRLGFGDAAQALSAYERAVSLDPALAEPTFAARWRAATAARPARLISLANEHLNAHPDDPLAAYYLGQALTARGTPETAIRRLIETLEEQESPAAVWFALGEAYAATRAWTEALTCLEQARILTQSGDDTLALVSDTPVADLFAGLGEAYFYTGRCLDAQIMLEYALAVGPDRPEVHTLIGRALICQTPTPTPTPYPWMAP
jgi:tetratricopeptide (TPR) repeat protein